MYGLTRGVMTLIGAAAAGVLLWLGANVVSNGTLSMGEHWGAAGLVALAGLAMALSQLLGGWTKWGWPRVSGNVFLIAFLPVLVAGSWIIAASEPGEHWLGGHVRNWSGDLGIGGAVADLTSMVPAIAFGIGLVFGLTFDTTGPRIRKQTPVVAGAHEQGQATDGVTADDRAPVAADDQEQAATADGVTDDRRVHVGNGGALDAPDAEPATAPKPEEPTRS